MSNRLTATALQCLDIGPIDLVVEGGQCLAVVGPSGSGKSLILRMIADLIPHQGECSLDGVLANAMPSPQWRKHVRYVSSEPGWWATTVAEHFADLATLVRCTTSLGLPTDLGSAAPERLSTGERQRVALLRAIEQRPQVLLLDEPTSALDTAGTLLVEALVRDLMASGMAIILVSHNPEQVARLASATLSLGQRP
ncbi:ABC transporter ATP-binding protein [Devosia sp. 2618]|uniref:ABC transporter ATP-binding protein n=1 Tax=Devosia sp. 2618 TaxID=3156454 RepID=UPI003398FD03